MLVLSMLLEGFNHPKLISNSGMILAFFGDNGSRCRAANLKGDSSSSVYQAVEYDVIAV